MLTRIDHVGIACRDLDAAIDFYHRTYGLTVTHVEDNEEQGVREAMLRINTTDDGHSSYLQLLQPLSEDSPVGRFLARHGEGVHHVAFGTEDVSETRERVAETGVRPLSETPRPGSMGTRIAFLHPKDCGGVLTELVQAPLATGVHDRTP